MCGILAAVSKEKLSLAELKALKELFVVTTLRGIDSTGILIADTLDENIYRLWKEVGNFYDCAGDPSVVENFKANLVMGHCRWATKGNVTKDNAHPYVFENFIGMHNGTLDDADYLPTAKGNEGFKDKTDSWIFFNKLDQHLKDGGQLLDFIKELTWWCAHAIIMWDKKSSLSFFRDYQRPLSIGVEKTSGTVFLASEKRFLEFIENKHVSFNIHDVKPGILYEIDMKKVGFDDKPWTETEIPETHWSTGTFVQTPGYTNPQSRYYDMYEYEDDESHGWFFDKKFGCWRNRADMEDVGAMMDVV